MTWLTKGAPPRRASRPEMTPSLGAHDRRRARPCRTRRRARPVAACTALMTRSARLVVATEQLVGMAGDADDAVLAQLDVDRGGSCRRWAGRSWSMPLKTPIIAAVRAVASLRLSPQGRQSRLSRRSTSIAPRRGRRSPSRCTETPLRAFRETGRATLTADHAAGGQPPDRLDHPLLAVVEPLLGELRRAPPSRSPRRAPGARARRSAPRRPAPGSRPATARARGCASRTCARCRRCRGSRAAPGRPGRSARPPRTRRAPSPCRWSAARCRVGLVRLGQHGEAMRPVLVDHRDQDRVVGGVRAAVVRRVVQEGVAAARGRGWSSSIERAMRSGPAMTWMGRLSATARSSGVGGQDAAREVAAVLITPERAGAQAACSASCAAMPSIRRERTASLTPSIRPAVAARDRPLTA